MGRPRSFDEREVVQRACRIFLNGYNATSVDDLVIGLNLHRGSIYKAFGSKRGLFLAALRLQADTVLADAVATHPACGD
jgi:TetR/AcrR family transcriptional repressor of nem operon